MRHYVGTKFIKAEPEEFHGVLGYKVEYPDGYISWSPKETFEEAYSLVDGMTFGIALELIKKGVKVARKGWNGKGIYITSQIPDEYSKMSSPYIYIDTTGVELDGERAPKKLVPWAPSQTDLFAEDWIVVEDKEEEL